MRYVLGFLIVFSLLVFSQDEEIVVISERGWVFTPSVNTLIDEDKVLMKTYAKFMEMMEECNGGETKNSIVRSNWVVRLELNREKMLDI